MPPLEPLENARIVHEHPEWSVVYKPPFLLTHPTRPGGPPTLLDWLRSVYPGEEVACVNRLDRETSGLVLASRTKESASTLGKQIMAGAIHKTYLALVTGDAPPQGEINAPLGRLCQHGPCDIYVKQGVLHGGAHAVTRFQRLATRRRPTGGEYVSLLQCRTDGGRLHQIRAHLAHAGLPIVGDKLYGPSDRWYLRMIDHGWTSDMQEALWMPHQCLHAQKLQFDWLEQTLNFHADPPPTWQEFWESLETI